MNKKFYEYLNQIIEVGDYVNKNEYTEEFKEKIGELIETINNSIPLDFNDKILSLLSYPGNNVRKWGSIDYNKFKDNLVLTMDKESQLALQYYYYIYVIGRNSYSPYRFSALFNREYVNDTFECITDLITRLTDTDKLKLKKSLMVAFNNKYNIEKLLVLLQLYPGEVNINYSDIDFINNIDNLDRYSELVEPLNVELIKNFLNLVIAINSGIYSFNTNIINLMDLIFLTSSEILVIGDYKIMSSILDMHCMKEAPSLLLNDINPKFIENYRKIAKYYIEFISNQKTNIFRNRVDKIIEFSNSSNNNPNSFVKLLYSELVNYDGDNDKFLKEIITKSL